MNLQVIPPNPKAVRWYSVVVSISGCDPLDPGSNPGTAILFLVFFFLSYLAEMECDLEQKRVYIRWDSNPRQQS